MPVLIVGVLNLTPDSFSDGGRFASVDDAVAAGEQMSAQGADWIDIGGESTRPGSVPVPEDEEIARVLPTLERLSKRLAGRSRLSIDTYKAGTARAALAAGASVVNDISGGVFEPSILTVAAQAGAGVVLGHVRGRPATMMTDVHYGDVVGEVSQELAARVSAALAAGCREVWADPGIGFGKTTFHNLLLLRELSRLRSGLGRPLMVGVSRKRFVGEITGQPAHDRTFGTAAAVTAAVLGGADAVRVHDVREMLDVVRVAEAIAKVHSFAESH
jgi:dihydropteroate synthase